MGMERTGWGFVGAASARITRMPRGGRRNAGRCVSVAWSTVAFLVLLLDPSGFELGEMALHPPHGEPPEHLGVEALEPALVLGEELGLEGPRPDPQDRKRHRPVRVRTVLGLVPLR